MAINAIGGAIGVAKEKKSVINYFELAQILSREACEIKDIEIWNAAMQAIKKYYGVEL
jgi:hypothetical protein